MAAVQRKPEHTCPQFWCNCCALKDFCFAYLSITVSFYCLCREEWGLGIITPRKYAPSWKN